MWMDLLWNVYLLIIRCLDILISSDLLWANPIKDVTSKVRKQIGLLYCHFYKHAELDTLKMLYTALIWPHLKYAVPVWHGIHISAKILTFWSQRFATKICIKSWNALHNQDHLATLHLDTLHNRRASLAVHVICTNNWLWVVYISKFSYHLSCFSLPYLL